MCITRAIVTITLAVPFSLSLSVPLSISTSIIIIRC